MRLVEVLANLAEEGADRYTSRPGRSDESTAEGRVAVFLAGIADQLNADDGTVTGAALRRAAVSTGWKLLDESPDLHAAVAGGGTAGAWRLGDDLFGLLFRLFFGDFFSELLASALAEHLVGEVFAPDSDPVAHMTEWAARRIAAELPNPCQEKKARGHKEPLPVVARSLLEEVVNHLHGESPREGARAP
ncbi:hypothetical protein [Streptomyces iconiensis]|uniref:Uncharacterized protein n=1 Tax=Streptomyces iconiensis TaxID=1384038 RepID=A0ABT7A0U4_9ACTN|nr:hypothetical protein [Streptomyces iconiensis]MDJ1134957.1 hypothetical protein [Streptomyces iconiensis]